MSKIPKFSNTFNTNLKSWIDFSLVKTFAKQGGYLFFIWKFRVFDISGNPTNYYVENEEFYLLNEVSI